MITAQSKPRKICYTARTPEGIGITRISTHPYTHACLVSVDGGNWGAQFSASMKGAQTAARKWENCPAVKNGQITVVTQIVKVEI